MYQLENNINSVGDEERYLVRGKVKEGVQNLFPDAS
jgi:hypothetical protein